MSQNTDNLLLSIINSKDAIKAALESKGVDMTDVNFSDYSDKILEMLGYEISDTLWTPTQLNSSQMLIWLDANADGGVTKNESNLISSWNDLSGNSRHATGGNAPLHYYDETLGKWVVRFDGGNDYLNTTLSFMNGGATDVMIFFVCRRRGTKTYHFVFGGTDTTGPFYTGWINTEALLTVALRSISGTNQISYGYNSSNFPLFFVSSKFDFTNAVMGIGVNGKPLTEVAIAFNPTIGTQYIGRHASLYYNGDIMEYIVVSGIDSNLRQKIEGYLTWKWAGAGPEYSPHPYNAHAPKIIT